MGPFQQCLLEINKITSSLCPSIQYDIVSLFQPTQTFLVSFLDTTSVTAAAIPMFLKYLSCYGQLSISLNRQMHGRGFWVWDCQFSPHHTWTSALRCRCGLHTWMGRESRCSACSRDEQHRVACRLWTATWIFRTCKTSPSMQVCRG